MGNGSISEAQTGVIPQSSPPKGKPPEPSNRLPRVRFLSLIFALHLFHKVGVRYLFSVSHHIHAIGIAGIVHIPPQDDRGVLLIQFHRIADPVHLLTGHQRGTGTAEGIDDHSVFLRGISDRVAQQVERLGGRMIGVPLRLGKVPDGGLLAVGIPFVLAVLHESVENRLVLPLVIRAPQHQGILHPDTASGEVESRVHKCPAEVRSFRIDVEHIRRTSLFQMVCHVLKRCEKEPVKLLVLDGQTAGTFERDAIGRVGQGEVRLDIAHKPIYIIRIGGISTQKPVSAHCPDIPAHNKSLLFQSGCQVVIVILCLAAAVFGKEFGQFLIVKSCEGHIKVHAFQRLDLHPEQFLIPSGIHCHAVVRKDICFLLCLGEMVHKYVGDFGNAFFLGGDPAVSGYDVVIPVDDDGIHETELAQGGAELRDLLRGVGMLCYNKVVTVVANEI